MLLLYVGFKLLYALQMYVRFVVFHQVFEGDECNDGDISEDTFKPVTERRDVRNLTETLFFDYFFVAGRPYKIAM